MATFARKCAQCGTVDRQQTWASTDEAARSGALGAPWTCPTCAWTDSELVDVGDTPGTDSPPPASPPPASSGDLARRG